MMEWQALLYHSCIRYLQHKYFPRYHLHQSMEDSTGNTSYNKPGYNVQCIPDTQKGRKLPDSNRPCNWLGFKLDLEYVFGVGKGWNGSGMHAKTTVIRCTKSRQSISRYPLVRQIDGTRVNNLRHASTEQSFITTSVSCSLFCLSFCMLVVLHGCKRTCWCCASSITAQNGAIKSSSSHCWWKMVVVPVNSTGTWSRALSLHQQQCCRFSRNTA